MDGASFIGDEPRIVHWRPVMTSFLVVSKAHSTWSDPCTDKSVPELASAVSCLVIITNTSLAPDQMSGNFTLISCGISTDKCSCCSPVRGLAGLQVNIVTRRYKLCES